MMWVLRFAVAVELCFAVAPIGLVATRGDDRNLLILALLSGLGWFLPPFSGIKAGIGCGLQAIRIVLFWMFLLAAMGAWVENSGSFCSPRNVPESAVDDCERNHQIAAYVIAGLMSAVSLGSGAAIWQFHTAVGSSQRTSETI